MRPNWDTYRIVTEHASPADKDLFTLLKELSETPGVSGQEQNIRAAAAAHMAPLVDEMRVDTLGNLAGLKKGKSPCAGRVMLAAHMDEIGLIITKLDNGFLRFATVGGVDLAVLPAQEVTVHAQEDLPGLIASRPPHVLSREERERPFTQEQLFIDVGLPAGELAETVAVGDFVSVRRSAERMAKGRATGKAFDNRVSIVRSPGRTPHPAEPRAQLGHIRLWSPCRRRSGCAAQPPPPSTWRRIWASRST